MHRRRQQAATATEGGSVGTVESGANGNFEITLQQGTTLPCLGSVRLPGGTTMFSIIPGGNPPVININFTPLTDAFTWSVLSSVNGNNPTGSPESQFADRNSNFSRTLDSRMTFNTAKADFTNQFTGKYGINITSAAFDFLSDPIVVGQPEDDALEAMRPITVPENPRVPTSPMVPLLNPDGGLSPGGISNIIIDAPPLPPSSIVPCNVAGNSCGGSAGRTIVITGGTGS